MAADWQKKLSYVNFSNATQALSLTDQESLDTHTPFPLRVTERYFNNRLSDSLNDPLLRQILPRLTERLEADDFSSDPIAEKSINPLTGVLQRYQHRALLILTGACPIHCRYCFRRHFPYAEQHIKGEQFNLILDYLKSNTDIHEVIYSGGDPLMLSDARLSEMTSQIEAIPHIKRLRIHTRMPVVFPERICDELLSWMSASRLQRSVVIHCNHPNEIDETVQQSLLRLKQVANLLNQSVLLAGVNDDATTLIALSERLFEAGVLPYYLHALDKVEGAVDFFVPDEKGLALMQSVREYLPGYLVPRFVRTVPNEKSKILIK